MISQKRTSILVSILMLSMLAMPVLGNDAGTGGDAGDSISTATNIPASNASYYGNLSTSGDVDDYYSVNMSNNTGIVVQLNSPSGADFDLHLYSSSGGSIDTSFTTGTDEVTSNGTNVGGTTVYIRIDQWTGSGQYTLQVWIFSTGGGGGGSTGNGTNGYDAGTGNDAGDTMASAMVLNATNMSFWGEVTYSTDVSDYYKISMPANFGVSASLSWNSTADLDLEVYDDSGTIITYSWFNNPENISVNNYGGSDLFFKALAYGTLGSGSHDYNLSFNFVDMTNAPVNNQDDAGTGGDASNDYLNPTNLLINAVSVNNSFNGWGSLNDDLNDNYQANVPMGYGVAVSVWFNATNVDFQVILGDDQTNTIDYSSVNNPEYVTSNGSGTYPGMIVEGMDVLVQVRATSGEGDYGMSWWFFTLDSDGDGFYDMTEEDCGSDPEDNNSVPVDTDSDGLCDSLDMDDDGDNVEDANDTFPLDSSEWEDTDNDNIGNNADSDDDGDGFTDSEELECGSDPLLGNSIPADFDSDLTCDAIDDDDDNDGYADTEDIFPMNDEEWYDSDLDGIGNNADTDDDGDGYSDNIETSCDSDPLSAFSIPSDLDGDGSCDLMDGDMDGDNYPNAIDAFPADMSEWFDTDNDGIGNNLDGDDDGDSISDAYDAFPLDSTEWVDNDNDGLGDNSDTDDDNDGWSDLDEESCNTDSMSSLQIPVDYDADGICDLVDDDDDNDGVPDISDMFPNDNAEWDDTDFDGIGDNFDDDDDGDNWLDIYEPNCGTDPLDGSSIPLDFDQDWLCDLVDNDDDNDLVPDIDDAFPMDPTEQMDTDSDGKGDNTDSDDDGDGWADTVEALCQTSSVSSNSIPSDLDGDGTCDLLDADKDGDNILNQVDKFPEDPLEWEDRNGDGKGDNAYPLSITDKMALNPVPTFLILFVIIAMIGGSVVVYTVKKRTPESALSYQRGTDMTDYTEQDMVFDEDNSVPDAPPMPEMPPMPESSVPEAPPMPEKPPLPESSVPEAPPMPEIQSGARIPPPPPGFESVSTTVNVPEIVSTWEDLPPGGDYTNTDPLQYTGQGIGVWEEREDESWIKLTNNQSNK
ncbi:MSCRAMM family adhesin SdrC [Euryarchaeota archaeon]|nr:MSCRAMM family adhesin SdrC [Euryarchaeota archaeon]